MSNIIFFLLAGMGIGSLYAMLGTGLVVSYQGSGVINFAHGALAMYGVATFDRVWHKGELFLPWVDIIPTHQWNLPVRITVASSGSTSMWLAMAIAIAMSVLLGLGTHYLVFRPLRHASQLGKVVASLGLALYLQGVALLNFGTSYPTPKSIYPVKAFQNFLGLGNPMPLNTVMAVVAAVVMGAIVWALYRFSRWGLAVRAASANEKGAVLLGFSPQFLAGASWVLASVLAGLAAILVGPIQGAIQPASLTAFIVPALAASLIGNFRSIPVTIIGGLGLGMTETLLTTYKDKWFTWTHITDGIVAALPLLIIVAVLFFRGHALPIRGTVDEQRLPIAPDPVRVGQHSFVWFVVLVFWAFAFQNAGGRTVFAGAMQTSLVFMIIMLSLVVLTGYTGQISLLQMSLAGVAAFFMARMMADGSGQGGNLVPVPGPGFPWPIAATLGIVVAVLVGVIVGLPAVRIRGMQLAVVTIAAAIAIQSIYLDNSKLTGFTSGTPADISVPTFFGINIGSRSDRSQNDRPAFIIFEAVVLIAVAVAVAGLRRAGTGKRFLATRANERAAAAAGIDVTKTKLLSFAISAAIAGAGGVMLAFKQVQVSSGSFPYTQSLAVLAFAYLGGITSINGGIVAGALVAGGLAPVFSNYFYASSIERYLSTIAGAGLIITAIVHPPGIARALQPEMRHAGNWILSAFPGGQTLNEAYVGSRRRFLNWVLGALIVGVALVLYFFDDTIVNNNLAWALIVAAGAGVVLILLASTLGELTPSFGGAAREWANWARQFGPTALIGYIAGWLIWPLRGEQYSKLYMPLVGAGLALMFRSIIKQLWGAYQSRRTIKNQARGRQAAAAAQA